MKKFPLALSIPLMILIIVFNIWGYIKGAPLELLAALDSIAVALVAINFR